MLRRRRRRVLKQPTTLDLDSDSEDCVMVGKRETHHIGI
jgi:hypothetical protein